MQDSTAKYTYVSKISKLRASAQRTVPGWKSDMEKQILRSGWKRPDGVNIWRELVMDLTDHDAGYTRTLIPGGLKGYSEGKRSTPWYSPPAKGESGGPRCQELETKPPTVHSHDIR
jgi:hypothetical protein